MSENVKSWLSQNWMAIVSGLLILGMTYGIMQATVNTKIDLETARELTSTTIKENVTPFINRNSDLIGQLLLKDASDTKIQLEIKFNLRRLMESQGLNYIENTDK